MKIANTTAPTTEESAFYSITAFKGIEVGIGTADPLALTSRKLQEKYPDHLVLIQAGTWLHGYDRTAYVLNALRGYKLKMGGKGENVHLQAGFPIGGYKRRLWSIVRDLGIPYVVSIGKQETGYTVYVSEQPAGNTSVLSAVPPNFMQQTIESLQQRGEITKISARQVIDNPDMSGFKLKSRAQELDTLLLNDILKMPRHIRASFGEALFTCSTQIVRGLFAYGMDENKLARLNSISANVDELKYRLSQAKKLNLKFALESRVGLAVELGNLLGGVIRARQDQP